MSYDGQPRETFPAGAAISQPEEVLMSEPQAVPGFVERSRHALGQVAGMAMDLVDAAPRPARRITGATAAGLAALAMSPAGAEASIVIGKGIGPVRIGQSEAQVKHELGSPYNAFYAPQTHTEDWGYAIINGKYPAVTEVVFQHGKVASITAGNPKQKAPKNIGAGSPEASVKKAYPGITCKAETPKSMHITNCYLETKAKKPIFTTFVISKGKVEMTTISTLA